MISTQHRAIESLVADVHSGKLLLPELQRSYVWKTTQVRDFFDSLYHQYPSGQLLVWQTDDLPYSHSVGISGVASDEHKPQLLLDGQQRITSLAAVMLGEQITTREKKIDIVFNVFTEIFEVASSKHKGQSGWVSLARFFTNNMAVFADLKLDLATPEGQKVLARLTQLGNIRTYKYQVNVLEDLTYPEVTHIFVRINSGGTRLGNADLALAQVSSRWRGVTEELDNYRDKVRKLGWELDNSLLLRAMTALLTKQSFLSKLFSGERQRLTIDDLQAAWKRTRPAMDQAINFIIHNCLIDRLSLMPTANVLIPLVVFFDHFGKNVTMAQARELQRWLYMALIWSRYSGSVETNLDQDITALGKDEPIQHMIQNIEDKVGRRPVTERELQGELSNSPLMLMAYVLARRAAAKDWFNGVAIGGAQSLEFHHIFPKALLKERYDLTRDSRVVNQVANLAFLSARANAHIAAQPPAKYLEGIDEAYLKAQYVPLDRSLWGIDRFEDFLLARRIALADAINQFLQSLTDKPALWTLTALELLETRIDVLEQQFRELIAARLTTERGELAWKHCVPVDIQEAVHGRIEQRIKKNPFEAGQYEMLTSRLENCLFSDYLKIVLSNWAMFEEIFGQKQQFSQRFTEVLAARNALKHGNELNPSQRAFAEGGLIWLEDCLRHAAVVEEEDEAQAASE